MTTPLAHLETEIQPSASFAANLRNRLLRESAIPAARNSFYEHEYVRFITRRRLLDLAAVALLLLTTIAGLIRVAGPASNSATPTSIAAPTTPIDTVQQGGTAAQDNQYPGPAPTTGTAEITWTIPREISTTAMRSFVSGNTYFAQQMNAPDGFTGYISAYDIRTGKMLWRTTTVGLVPFAISEVGVVTAVPVDESNKTMALAILDPSTGDLVWQSQDIVDFAGATSTPALIIDGTVAYFAPSSGRLIAVDLVARSTRWNFTWVSPSQSTPAEATPTCSEKGATEACFANTSIPIYLASHGDTVYVAEQASMVVYAVESTTGHERWKSDLTVPTNDQNYIAQLMALDSGVAVRTSWSLQSGGEIAPTVTFLAAVNGEARWTNNSLSGSPLVSDGRFVFAAMLIDQIPYIASIDSDDGTIGWTYRTNGSQLGFMSSSGDLVLSTYPNGSMIGLDPQTQQITWTVDPGETDCFFTLPGNGTNQYICKNWNAEAFVIAVNPTPPVATVQQGGTAAQDNQYPGPAPTSGTAETVWTVPGAAASFIYPSLIAGDTLYTRIAPLDDSGTATMQAWDIAGKSLLWEATVTDAVPFAITDAGVVTAIPAGESNDGSDAVNPFTIALLDRADGQILWTSPDTFHTGPTPTPLTLSVTADTIYLTTGNGHLAALNLQNGTQRWTYDWDTAVNPRLEDGFCTPNETTADQCTDRSVWAPFVAIQSDSVYISDQRSFRLIALDAANGTLRWNIDILDTIPGAEFLTPVVALDSGVAVMAGHFGATLDSYEPTLAIFSSESGELVWQTQETTGAPFASDGTTLFLSIASDQGTFVSALDGATGTKRWQSTVSGAVAAYYPESDQIAVWSEATLPVGLDARTGEQTWTLDSGLTDCSLGFMATGDGLYLCYRYDNSPSIIEIIPEVVASPGAP